MVNGLQISRGYTSNGLPRFGRRKVDAYEKFRHPPRPVGKA